MQSKMFMNQLLLLSVFVVFKCSAFWPFDHSEKTKLLLVQTIFRHGDRGPLALYPNDPNSADDFPNGLGELTQLGKKQHFEVGKYLRSMYGDFVDSNPNEIYVNSSAENRCLNSAASNLASFYSPTWEWMFQILIFWQPVPVHYESKASDIYLNFQSKCKRSDIALERSLNSNQIQEFYQTHQKMVQDVSKESGLNFSNPIDALVLVDTLEVEKIHNLKIPKWAKTYWDELQNFLSIAFSSVVSSPVQRKLRIGPFLELLVENMEKKLNGNSNLKFILNSSHDLEVLLALRALNFTNIPRPPYCATVLFELHEMSDESKAVRIRYMNSTDPTVHIEKPQVLVLDGCSEFCPVEKFTQMLQSVIPDSWEEACEEDS